MKTYKEEIIFFDRGNIFNPKRFEETIVFENVVLHPNYQQEIETENWYAKNGEKYHSEILEAERAYGRGRVSNEMGKRYNTREYAGGSIDWEYYTKSVPGPDRNLAAIG